jgi:glycosyltransferase involved in cell wall biosynthesis
MDKITDGFRSIKWRSTLDVNLRSRRGRLLLVVDSLDMGGAERHVIALGSGLAEVGHDVTIACSSAGVLASMANDAGLHVRPLLNYRIKRHLSFPFAYQLGRFLRRQCFDLVHAHIYASAAASAVATLGMHIPLLLTEHTEASWRTYHARLISRFVYRRASHIIAVSEAIRSRLVDVDKVPQSAITVIPNAYLPPPQSLPKLQLRHLIGRPSGPVIGMVARLQPEKGVVDFLEAAKDTLQIFPDGNFVVVGDGPLRHELAQKAEQLGIARHVQFLGLRLDGPALISQFDILVVPSIPSLSGEGTPLVVLEAMAAGVPVVATAVGGIPEQVRHKREGLLVPPGNHRAFGEAIMTLLGDPVLAQRLGQAGRKRISRVYSYTAMLSRIDSVYSTVLQAPS